eukprot:Tbor_TRINITY_DN4218_c0_g1::TRINITY_DN4218_c0_g1_i1::g.23918::m.23918/K01921/ddl; D-alanine-D-alanine ligase
MKKAATAVTAVTAATLRLNNIALRKPEVKNKKTRSKIRVCVLYSSYEGTDSPTAAVDDVKCSPSFWVNKTKDNYTFVDVAVKKADSYSVIRDLWSSGEYDVFYNICDGAKDEKRAGIDVIQALESLNAAYTGADSRSFEPNKVDMKVLVANANVKTPNFVLLDNTKDLPKKCRHLKFPVIVKHMSGYASVGITKESRCENMQQLSVQVRLSIKMFNHALVEEFIRGKEGTVLVCEDPASPFGIRVFQPLMYTWLKGGDDFAYFDSKWNDDIDIGFMEKDDQAYPKVVNMARNAFKHIMNGVGYGRCDFRVDDNGNVYFLEINSNCGMLYDPATCEGGDFADMMVTKEEEQNGYGHDNFIGGMIKSAFENQQKRAPWYCITHDAQGRFSTRASVNVPCGTPLYNDPNKTIPVLGKSLYQLGEDDVQVGCVIARADGINSVVAIRHSCEPNMHFVHGPTLSFESSRRISNGEELTVDYATLRNKDMPAFACSCGTSSCRSVILPDPPAPRISKQKVNFDRRARLLRRRQKKALKAFTAASDAMPPISHESSIPKKCKKDAENSEDIEKFDKSINKSSILNILSDSIEDICMQEGVLADKTIANVDVKAENEPIVPEISACNLPSRKD